MEAVDIKDVTPKGGSGLQISAEQQLCAFSRYYSDRGLRKSVLQDAQKQREQEKSTRELAPDAYRMSSLSDAAIDSCYRRGKSSMAVNDLMIYFHETRAKRIRNVDFSENTEAEESPLAESQEVRSLAVAEQKPTRLLDRLRAEHKSLKEAAPTWFDSKEPDTSGIKKRFPLSAFAAIAAVAVSLMLIVASSVLITRAEHRTDQLNEQIMAAYDESGDLHAKLESRDNLLLIRRIATEEYGMVDEEYVKMQYITLADRDSIETFEDEKGQSAGISALLSAIGIR
ncbi:MAG: hypothetical protein E7629_04875 [Ruminococcaceae bacterium]|nr:hypothetical protein [Oscillospiraceae bacterium]